jgi:hypothetical protein
VAAANLPETPRGAAVAQPQAAKGAPAPGTEPLVAKGAPDLRSLSLKDYHRVVRASYVATEGPSAGSSRIRSYLPFALLVLLLILGAAVIFGHMP